jgi:Fe-S-cluster containining protein
MHPACEECGGACCEGMTLNLTSVLTSDTLEWFSFHGEPSEHGITLACRCSKLKRGKCSIYDTRPKVCQDYKVGSEACRSAIKRLRPHKQERLEYLINATT